MSLFSTIRFITAHPVNRGRALDSILRFARWQIGSRLVRGDVVYNWINGTRFLVRTGDTGFTGNIYTGLHEFSDMGFLLHFLRREDVFVDVGANVGSYAILACGAVGSRGIAFEPVPGTFRRLFENMRLNHLDGRLNCVNKGVGAESGVIAFSSGLDATNHALATGEKCDAEVAVEMTSLDLAVGAEAPALIKIDVEGYEALVVQGAQGVLGNPSLRAVIMELNGSGSRYGFDESAILRSMTEHGFGTFSYDPLSRKLVNLSGKNPVSGNTLFIRDRAAVEDRLMNAQGMLVHGRQI